jgi:hypothetical protein
MASVMYKCVKEITVYDRMIKDPIEVEKGTQWQQTRIDSLDSFQELRCDGFVIELPDELVERHFKKV